MIIARDLSSKIKPVAPLPTTDERKAKKSKSHDTAGPAWFNMPAPELTEELKQDIQVVKMRAALDPKPHYRKNERILESRYLQVGTVIADPTARHNDRLTRRQRGTSIVDTLLRDQQRRTYLKNKFSSLQATSQAAGRASYKRPKRLSWQKK